MQVLVVGTKYNHYTNYEHDGTVIDGALTWKAHSMKLEDGLCDYTAKESYAYIKSKSDNAFDLDYIDFGVWSSDGGNNNGFRMQLHWPTSSSPQIPKKLTMTRSTCTLTTKKMSILSNSRSTGIQSKLLPSTITATGQTARPMISVTTELTRLRPKVEPTANLFCWTFSGRARVVLTPFIEHLVQTELRTSLCFAID